MKWILNPATKLRMKKIQTKGRIMENPTPQKIRDAREEAGISQSKAGRLVCVGVRTWQKWELGERKMHPAFWELFNIKINGE